MCERGVTAIEGSNLIQILLVFQNILGFFCSFICHDLNFHICDKLLHYHTCTTLMQNLLKFLEMDMYTLHFIYVEAIGSGFQTTKPLGVSGILGSLVIISVW